MTSIYEPEAVPVQAMVKIAFVLALADPTAPDISTEVKASSSVEATMVIRQWNPTTNVNTGNAPARLGTRVQQPVEGNAQRQPIAITYPYDPSVADSDVNNKLKALLAQNTLVYAVVRKGTDIDTDWTVADRCDVWHVRAGYQAEEQSGDNTDEFAEFEMHQNLFPLVNKVVGILAA
jgi:hypothetical protein